VVCPQVPTTQIAPLNNKHMTLLWWSVSSTCCMPCTCETVCASKKGCPTSSALRAAHRSRDRTPQSTRSGQGAGGGGIWLHQMQQPGASRHLVKTCLSILCSCCTVNTNARLLHHPAIILAAEAAKHTYKRFAGVLKMNKKQD